MRILAVVDLSHHAPPRGRPKGAVGRLRAMHEDAARMFASGMKTGEIASLMRRTPATIRNWINSPAMAERMAEFEEEQSGRVQNLLDLRQALKEEQSLLANMELVRRLRDDNLREEIPATILSRLADSADDRTGLGKMETRLNVNADLGERLSMARARAAQATGYEPSGKVVPMVKRRA